ncbi:unnamed protein product [Brassica oleracea]
MPYKPAPLAPEFSAFTRISESDSTCIVFKPFRWHVSTASLSARPSAINGELTKSFCSLNYMIWFSA